METLKEQFGKTSNTMSPDAYITWLEERVKLAEDDSIRVIQAIEKAEKMTYTEDEVKGIIVQCFNHAFDCIKNRVSLDKIPSHIISHFETIKKK